MHLILSLSKIISLLTFRQKNLKTKCAKNLFPQMGFFLIHKEIVKYLHLVFI